MKCKHVLTNKARLFVIIAILSLSCSLFMIVWLVFGSKTCQKSSLCSFRAKKMPRLYVYRNLAMKEEVDCDQLVDITALDESSGEPDMIPETETPSKKES
ncbi:unnamed protein product [Soboliphyme baturini]|uniref:Transmembrane protein n=1 Tax=Soboliphyme baturini TaxID=241478 RepID=A0A183JB34_9BILA|nr:unnamed protein product [Soboliphyme baturini]